MTRRLLTTAIAFLFLALLCAPAVAGAVALVATPTEDEGCCCARDVETAHDSVRSEKCRCPACACTFEEAPPLGPMQLLDAPAPPALSAIEHVTRASLVPCDEPPAARPSAPRVARGPPIAGTPLYILYDTLLI